jgi:hypothetical protein
MCYFDEQTGSLMALGWHKFRAKDLKIGAKREPRTFQEAKTQ